MAPRDKITKLPTAVRDWLEAALVDGNFSGYEALAAMLRGKGYDISKSGLHRHGQKIQRRMAAVKASTEAARLIVDSAADNEDSRSEAIIALVQAGLFDSLADLLDATDEDVAPKDRVALLSKSAKNIAGLVSASARQKKHRMEVQAKVEAAAAAVEKIAVKGGLSAEGVAAIKTEVLGIAA